MTHTTTCADCGWTSSPCDTAKRAAYALSRHSCALHRHRQASAERGHARRAAVDRTPQPCRHKEASHEHGTYAAYTLDACRCAPCAAAVSEYERSRVRQQAYGRWTNLVDAEPSRRHVQQLMAQGMGLKRIVAVSDLSQGLLWKLIYGKRRTDGTREVTQRVRPATELRILALELDLAGGVTVDGTGTRRRLQALVAVGWSQSKLADRLAMSPGNFGRTIRNDRVQIRTQRAVAAMYDELWDQQPARSEWRDLSAFNRARNQAQRNGWLPPLAYDDDQIDDPTYQPELGRRVRVTQAERIEELQALGLGVDAIAHRLGVKRDSVMRALDRATKTTDTERKTA